jgi:hypothetical protein
MPSNSAEYQKRYRKSNPKKRKVVSVSLDLDEHALLKAAAKQMQIKHLSAFLREASLNQARMSQMQRPEVTAELKDWRLQLSGIANNINQIARHSNEVKHVVDSNDFYAQLKSLQELYEALASSLSESTK